jgi:hypothetical protein
MKSVSHCQWTGSGILAHCEDNKGVKHRIGLMDVRAGVWFPTGGLPGYYVMFGRRWDTVPTGKAQLLYLTEHEDIMHEPLFRALTDDCTKFRCKTLYAHLLRHDRRGGIGGYDDLWRYLKNRKLNVNLVPAPAAEDVDYGAALIREYIKDEAIEIPDTDETPTILRKQLSLIEPKTDKAPLYAFSALRFVLGGFVKFNNVIPYMPRSGHSEKANPKGWT